MAVTESSGKPDFRNIKIQHDSEAQRIKVKDNESYVINSVVFIVFKLLWASLSSRILFSANWYSRASRNISEFFTSYVAFFTINSLGRQHLKRKETQLWGDLLGYCLLVVAWFEERNMNETIHAIHMQMSG